MKITSYSPYLIIMKDKQPRLIKKVDRVEKQQLQKYKYEFYA